MYVMQVAYILCNLAYHGSEFSTPLLGLGAIQGMVPLLKVSDTDTVHLALSFTDMMLRDTDNVSPTSPHPPEQNTLGLNGYTATHETKARSIKQKILVSYFSKFQK